MNKNKGQLPVGMIIGNKYEIVRSIGQGGMAYVYLAIDLMTSRQVAVKVMRDELSDDPEFIKRFETEARAASSLDHPNIVKVLDYGQDGDIRYIVQEYVQGKTLKTLITEQGTLDWRLAVPLVIQIALALEHAHQRRVIHRDIKPQNILITQDMVAKVTDFGIARASNTNTITLTGGVAFGSVHYFSPEQARGSVVTEKSDLYSLGIVLYEMVTGVLPFDGDTSVAVAIKHLQEMPQSPSSFRQAIPPQLDNIIIKCIQKNPESRYLNAREFVNELDAFLANPNGIYGVIPVVSGASRPSTALDLQQNGSDFNRIRDLERNYKRNKKAKVRENTIVVSIIILVIILISILVVWGYRNLSGSIKDGKEIVLEEYVGQNIQDVELKLKEQGIKIEIKYRQDDTIPEGVILQQKPEANVKVKIGGTPVEFLVSSGKERFEVEDYTNQSAIQVITRLKVNNGWDVEEQKEESEDIANGYIIRTIPAAGQKLGKGEKIIVVVSEGSKKIIMPNLIGKKYLDVVRILEEKNLSIGVETNVHKDESDTIVSVDEADRIVISQTINEGDEIEQNATVDISYGTMEDYIGVINPTTTSALKIMPQFAGKNLTEAYKLMQDLGVQSYNVMYPNESNRELPQNQQFVLKQNVAPGMEIDLNESFTLTIGSYEDYLNENSPHNEHPDNANPHGEEPGGHLE